MSTRSERTQTAILDSAWRLVRERGAAHTRMEDVAAAAEVSRQTVYLHFENRTRLMVALVDHVDRQSGLGALLAPVFATADPVEALEGLARVVARYSARIHDIALALDVARHSDEAAAAAWHDRMSSRRKGIRMLVARVHEQGRLRAGWTVARVTDAIWALGAPHTYGDLVVERGWSIAAFEAFLVEATRMFVRPAAAPRKRGRSRKPSK